MEVEQEQAAPPKVQEEVQKPLESIEEMSNNLSDMEIKSKRKRKLKRTLYVESDDSQDPEVSEAIQEEEKPNPNKRGMERFLEQGSSQTSRLNMQEAQEVAKEGAPKSKLPPKKGYKIVKKTKYTKDAKGYLVGEDYDSYEEMPA